MVRKYQGIQLQFQVHKTQEGGWWPLWYQVRHFHWGWAGLERNGTREEKGLQGGRIGMVIWFWLVLKIFISLSWCVLEFLVRPLNYARTHRRNLASQIFPSKNLALLSLNHNPNSMLAPLTNSPPYSSYTNKVIIVSNFMEHINYILCIQNEKFLFMFPYQHKMGWC